MKLLELSNLQKQYGENAVIQDISMDVTQGEVVAIIGPSGSGKSTLLRCATLLEPMDGGNLTYLGERAVTEGTPAGPK
ncbi:MAG: ATP-binding cassette domain-containing protein, partial [Oscillospiraceae bacterium]